MTKPKHLILYHTNFSRNDGSPLYYLNAMRDLGMDVTHLKPDGDISQFGSFDFTWVVDYGEDGLPVDHDWKIPKNCGKTIYIASDTHLGKEYRFKKAMKFDHVFFNQKNAVSEYLNGGWGSLESPNDQTVIWLPHAAEPKAYPKIEILKKFDVCFVGHVQETENFNGLTRVDALDRLFKEFPNFYYGSRHPAFPGKNLFEDAARKFSQSKVVFNISIKDDLNMRIFETLMTGSFLLTNWLPTLTDLEDLYGLKDGVHYVSYKTLDEMVEKARYYIDHDEQREKIAARGYELAIEKLTYSSRVKTVLNILGL